MRSTIRSRHHRPRPLNLVSVLIPTQFCVNLSKSSVCCVSSVMASEVEFWRQDAATKAEGIARDVERLSRQARAAGLSVTAPRNFCNHGQELVLISRAACRG